MSFPEPWDSHPHIWKTKSAFFTYLRGAIRKAVWSQYPAKLDFKNKEVDLPPDGYEGRAKSGKHCALSGEWIGKSKLEVDHIKGNVSLKGWEDLLNFTQHMCKVEGNLQLVGKEPHKIKSYAEKQGITYAEAVVQKKKIAFFNDNTTDQAKVKLRSLGATEEEVKNKETRESAYFKYIAREV